MSDIETQIEKYREKVYELAELKEDALGETVGMTVTAVGLLLEKLNDGIDDLVELSVKKDYFDKDLGKNLKETISEAITAFSKINAPIVNVTTPQVNVDLRAIAETNKTLIGLIEKLNNGNNSDELVRLVTAMIGKQNIFLEKSFQQIDNTKELKNISDGILKRPTEFEGIITEYNNQGRISKWKIKVTK